ncbi:MAG: DNA repair protein RadA [Micrococcaceae bacterium]
MSKKTELPYVCSECGAKFASWMGRCTQCQQWGTLEEKITKAAPRTQASVVNVAEAAQAITSIDTSNSSNYPTGVSELDRVLGGGLVPGSVVLMAGEPGIGKSTLILDVAAKVAQSGLKALYISAEESESQVTLRAQRIGALADELFLVSETDLGTVLGHIEDVEPELLVIDSIQTLSSTEVDGVAGGTSQVKEVAGAIINTAKKQNITTLIVGHVTKDGTIAGPRTLEHLVDVVCQFEGDRHSTLRMVRAVKNRYGPTDEVGCFDLGEEGIKSVEDPSGLFISSDQEAVSGTCITVTLEGKRPLLAEVQALVAQTNQAQPRRASSGLDSARCSMLLAVLQRRAGFPLSKYDSYLATVGGVKLTEPAVDLAAAIALTSAYTDKPVPQGTVVFGEVGLAGEVRQVPGIAKRVQEAARMGFKHALVPVSTQKMKGIPADFKVTTIKTLSQALHYFSQ